jgi:hypothetical protein
MILLLARRSLGGFSRYGSIDLTRQQRAGYFFLSYC